MGFNGLLVFICSLYGFGVVWYVFLSFIHGSCFLVSSFKVLLYQLQSCQDSLHGTAQDNMTGFVNL